MITQEYINERFTYRDGELYWKVVFSNRLKVGQLAGDSDGRGYRRVMLVKTHYKMHILIWIMHNGNIPDNLIVDHIDQNIKNNRLENLRLLTKSQNNLNSDKRKGVTFDKERNKWKAQTSVGNKNIMLGRFETEEEALSVYRAHRDMRISDTGHLSEVTEQNATTN